MDVQQTKYPKACAKEISEILYQNTFAKELSTLEGIEKAVRVHLLEKVSLRMGFFVKTSAGTTQGKQRTLKSCIRELKLRVKQLQRLGVHARG